MSTKYIKFIITNFIIMISIYTISCPYTNKVVYVGQTVNFTQRVKSHLTRFSNDPKSKWMKETIENGTRPVFKHIMFVNSKSEALKVESELIRNYLESGFTLLNSNYQCLYYKYDLKGNFIETITTIRGEKNSMIKMDRLTYKGFVYNTEPIFPKWKVDKLNESRSVLKKQVLQYSKDGEFLKTFSGVREAGRVTGIDHRSIQQVANGSLVRKSAGGFVWKYKTS